MLVTLLTREATTMISKLARSFASPAQRWQHIQPGCASMRLNAVQKKSASLKALEGLGVCDGEKQQDKL
jgi:hypothetical protein